MRVQHINSYKAYKATGEVTGRHQGYFNSHPSTTFQGRHCAVLVSIRVKRFSLSVTFAAVPYPPVDFPDVGQDELNITVALWFASSRYRRT